MKNTKRIFTIICAIVLICGCFILSYKPAYASSETDAVADTKGAQTFLITTNNDWNANLPGGIFNTIVSITIPIIYRDLYKESSFEQTKRIQVTTFKLVGDQWVKQEKLSGLYHCNGYSGILSQSFRLPGKGTQYKLVIAPEASLTNDQPADLSGIKLQIDYGSLMQVG